MLPTYSRPILIGCQVDSTWGWAVAPVLLVGYPGIAMTLQALTNVVVVGSIPTHAGFLSYCQWEYLSATFALPIILPP